MTTAFELPNKDTIPISYGESYEPKLQNERALESETEDEEVKLNCIGGVQGLADSDMNTSDSSDGEDDISDDDNNGKKSDRYEH
jgi:hypothetical protein